MHYLPAVQCLVQCGGLFQKRVNKGEGVEDMKFPGVLKKEHEEIARVNLKASEISWRVQEKIRNFHGFWILTLESPRSVTVTQFCRISWGENFFSLKFPRVITLYF